MNTNFADRTLAFIDGHVLIRDYDTNEVSLDKHNAINYENFSVAIASPDLEQPFLTTRISKLYK